MKVLVLSSGGDAPGMNRFVCDLYKAFKNDLYFAYAGFNGLVNGQIFKVSEVFDSSKKDEAGTIIKSSRCPEFKQKRVFQMGLKHAKEFDVVVILGGNGSEKGAKELFENGVNTIFVPGTIDNDVDDCAYSIGFSTAVKESVYAIENSMCSIEAFNNACLFEVMGRESDCIAQKTAKIVGADYVIADKESLDFEIIKNIILKKYINNKSACIVVRENIMPIEEIAAKLNELLGMDIVKTHIVGRTQRGGKPTKEELLMASRYAKETIRCIKAKVLGVRLLSDENMKILVKEFRG